VILGKVFIGPNVTTGDNCYVIGNTIINHDCNVGSHSFFSAGCTLAGHVVVGDRVKFDIASGSKAHVVLEDDTYIQPGESFSS